MAEALFHAQVALRTSRGEEVSNMKFGGEVEEITGVEQFQAAITLPGISVVYFMAALNQNCTQITQFVNALCTRYSSMNFLKVDINENPVVAKAENVRIVPTFKIYKNGTRVKEMICPSQQVLEYSVKHYVFYLRKLLVLWFFGVSWHLHLLQIIQMLAPLASKPYNNLLSKKYEPQRGEPFFYLLFAVLLLFVTVGGEPRFRRS